MTMIVQIIRRAMINARQPADADITVAPSSILLNNANNNTAFVQVTTPREWKI